MQFKALESLRGVAALMVALYHSAFLVGERSLLLNNSALSVDFFFILSGFVMTYAYRERIAKGMRFTDFASCGLVGCFRSMQWCCWCGCRWF